MNASPAFNANALDPQIGTLSSHSRRDGAYNAAGMRQADEKIWKGILLVFCR